MSRFRRVIHGAASGYLVLVASSLFSLASVPLALHYLSKDRFALWALMSSIGNYLSLIDLGMSNSVARLLIDHKDNRDGGVYGGMIKTGCLVLLAQAGIVFVVGCGLAPMLCSLLAIETDLQPEFIQLLRWQSLVWAVGFGTRIFSHLLVAHQRIDLINYTQIAGLGVSFVLLWIFFHAGQGVFSLVWSGLLGAFLGPAFWWWACWRLEFFPPAGAWGRASWHHFKEIFGYGKDLFLVGLGTQLITASQTMIITRRLGLEAAATWAIGTKVFALASQAVWRFSDVAGPALSEMITRGEHTLLRERYRTLVVATASLSVLASVIYAMCNSLFVSVWTHYKIDWPPVNDVLLAVWMIVSALQHCHNCFVLLTKKIGFLRYVYFIEGITFVSSAFLTVKWGGLPAMILCSIFCSTAFSTAYGICRVSGYFDLRVREVTVRWLRPAMRLLFPLTFTSLVGWWVLRSQESTILRLLLSAALSGLLGAYLFLRFGLPDGLSPELLRRAPRALRPILRHVLGSSAERDENGQGS